MKNFDRKQVMNITAEHLFFIPSVLILGIAIGFLIGQNRQLSRMLDQDALNQGHPQD
jgi:hypothetical protein